MKSLEKQLLQLPVPGQVASQHSEQLIDRIVAQIKLHNGRISFEHYMRMVLTEPGFGYYVSGNQKFGASGDFVTAPEISPLFSQCLANQCGQILSCLTGNDQRNILEFGAGSGTMAAEILLQLERQKNLPVNYFILELSAELKQRQLQTFQQKAPHLLDCVQWLESLPPSSFSGVILANEVLDAMPVHRFFKTGERLGEYYVAWNEGRFIWQQGEFSNNRLADRVKNISGQLPDEYISEVNLAAEAWVATIAETLKQGVVLIVDYGFPQHEYYHLQRNQGTLMCHYRHRSHDNPFVYPGLQDITAHVDFTAIAQAALDAGLQISGYTNQAFFLLANGLENFLQNLDPDSAEYMQLAKQVKTLTMPGEMGELFKAMALSKSYDSPLAGFQLKDMRSRL